MKSGDIKIDFSKILPNELISKILSTLTPDTRARAAVNKKLQTIVQDDHFWKSQFKQHFPNVFNAEDKKWYQQYSKHYIANFIISGHDLRTHRQNQLLKAILNDDVNQVDSLIKTGASSLTEIRNGETILRVAVKRNNQKILDLIYQGFPNLKGEEKFIYAVVCNQKEVMQATISSPFFHHYTTYTYEQLSAGHLLAQYNRLDMLKLLLSTKPAAEGVLTPNNFTLLHSAAAGGALETLNYLIERSENINCLTSLQAVSPLWLAVKYNQNVCAKALIDAGAQLILPNLTTQVMYLAIKAGNLEIVKKLISKDPSLLNKPEDGDTPLHSACQYQQTAIVEELLKNQAPLNIANEDGDYPIHIAIKKNDVETLAVLLKSEAELQKQTEGLNAELAIQIKEFNAKLAIQTDAEGKTPLMLALNRQRKACIDYLFTVSKILMQKQQKERQPYILQLHEITKQLSLIFASYKCLSLLQILLSIMLQN